MGGFKIPPSLYIRRSRTGESSTEVGLDLAGYLVECRGRDCFRKEITRGAYLRINESDEPGTTQLY